MLDTSQNNRLKELTERIERERDRDTVTKLLSELNALLDEQKKPEGASAHRGHEEQPAEKHMNRPPR